MSCVSPLHAYKAKSNDSDKIRIVFSRPQSFRGQSLDLPCGQCIDCRLERSRQWAVRCMHEASLYEDNCFITLTYSSENLPQDGSLVKSHFQNFMKRLRRENEKIIRFYHCGEYGEQGSRPHYHALLFNHDFKDKKLFSRRNDISLYTSDTLSRLWPFGFGVIGDLNFESAAYVARYCTKKITGPMAKDHYGNRLPEYSTMSRGSKKTNTGGIGKGWFDKFSSDIYPRDRVFVRGHFSRPPRFYDNLYSRQDRSTFELLKIKREKEASQRFVKDVLSDGTEVTYLDSSTLRNPVKEEILLSRLKNMRRSLEEL